MTALAAIAGYLIGSVPSASFLGRLQGVDLRTEGSGNPGTANALRTSGPWLASLVLIVEAGKGYAAVWVGALVGDEFGAIAAGLGALGGNVYNPWYRFQGGKGLGISLGVLAAAWPAAIVPILVVIVVGVLITRSSGIASLAAIAHPDRHGFSLVDVRMAHRRRRAQLSAPGSGGGHCSHHLLEALAGRPLHCTRPSLISRIRVTGPSFAMSTDIFAPKTPVHVVTPTRSKASAIAITRGSA